MSNHVFLDSLHRDRETYPSEFFYVTEPEQLFGFFRKARTVAPYSNPVLGTPMEFVSSIRIHQLTIPYHADFHAYPVLFVDIHAEKYNDNHLVSSLNGTLRDATFICQFASVQNDSGGVPTWIHYKCGMEQVMRYKRDDPVFIRIFSRGGGTLPQQDTVSPVASDPLLQTLIHFEVTPYTRDASYSHLVEPHM